MQISFNFLAQETGLDQTYAEYGRAFIFQSPRILSLDFGQWIYCPRKLFLRCFPLPQCMVLRNREGYVLIVQTFKIDGLLIRNWQPGQTATHLF